MRVAVKSLVHGFTDDLKRCPSLVSFLILQTYRGWGSSDSV